MIEGLCNGDCNKCPLVGHENSAMISAILNTIQIMSEDEDLVYNIVNKFCSNLTVCPECRIDDFGHIEHSNELNNCSPIRAARAYHEENKA